MPTTSDDRSSSRYYQELRDCPPPGEARELELFTEYRDALLANNRRTAHRLRDEIARGYLRFVIKRARSRSRNPDRIADLIGAGNIGLLVAIEKFDVSRGYRFLTYAGHWIDVYMRDVIYGSLAVHVPHHRQKEQQRARAQSGAAAARGEDFTEESPDVTAVPLDGVHELIPDETADVESAVIGSQTTVLDAFFAEPLSDYERLIFAHRAGLRGEPMTALEVSALLYVIDRMVVDEAEVLAVEAGVRERITARLRACGVLDADDVR